MPNRIPHVWSLLKSTAWAIRPEKLEEMIAVLRAKAVGADIQPYAVAERPQARTGNAVAVLPLFGIISQRANMITEFSGGTSIEKFTKQFRAALNDPEARAIVLDIASPGGGVFGVPELADEIFQAREQKRIVAVANAEAASAAYWIGAAASELVVTPSGKVGSIGVWAMHEDISKMEEQIGIKTTLISAGKYKVEGNPYEPLGDEARAYMQAEVDRYYDMFTAAVGKYRGVKQSEVRSGFGEGRMVGARDAVKLGMADRVATLDQTVARLVGVRPGVRARAETMEHDETTARPPEDGLSDEDRRRRLELQQRI